MIKYFHELSKGEFDEALKQKLTWAECAELYPQPIWCAYPEAVCGVMGCWSLMSFDDKTGKNWVTGRNYCKNCDCYIPKMKSMNLTPPQNVREK